MSTPTEPKKRAALTQAEKAIRAYGKMQEALRLLEKDRFEKAEPTLNAMVQVEGLLIDLMGKDKDMNALVEFYNQGRDELDVLDAQYKKVKAHVMLRQEKLEDVIFNVLRETNSESMRTLNGTAFTSTQTSVKIADWNIFLNFIVGGAMERACAEPGSPQLSTADMEQFTARLMKDEAWALLKRAASKDAVKAHIETEKKSVPGTDFSTRLQVSVRRK